MAPICIYCSEAASLIGFTERFRPRRTTMIDVMIRNGLQPAEQQEREEHLDKVQRAVTTVVEQVPTTDKMEEAVKAAAADPTDKAALQEVVKTFGSAVMSAIATKEEVRDTIEKAVGSGAVSDDIVQRVVANAAERTEQVADATKLSAKEVQDAVRSKRNTDRGTAKEDEDRKRHEKEQQFTATRVQDGYSLRMRTPEGVPYVVFGRLDGYDETTNSVVEYKHRAYRLLNRVPRYENVQLHLYMALTGAKRGQHVETYDDASNIHEVAFDPVFFDEIKRGLDAAVTEMTRCE